MSKEASQPPVAALVVLRPASGEAPGGFAEITAENVESYLPSSDDVHRARRLFDEAGFELGPHVGAAFSIAAPKARFEEYFGVEIAPGEDGVLVVSGAGPEGRDLPLDRLPAEVSERLVTVTFEPPAELDSRLLRSEVLDP